MTALELAEERCAEIEVVSDGDRFEEEQHMLVLWDEVKRLRDIIARLNTPH